MSSYCANNPEKCDEYADTAFGTDKCQVSFSDLTDDQQQHCCDLCNDDRIAAADWAYKCYKDRNL